VSAALLAVSLGCPSGIGPEVSVRAAARVKGARVVLVGDQGVVERAARVSGLDPTRFVRVRGADEARALARGITAVLQPGVRLALRDARPGAPSVAGGAAQLSWIDAACDLVRRGEASALVTGPVSKEVIARSGTREAKRFLGHTEHLQRRLGAREVVMAFHTARFTTSLVTTHLPLARVPAAITPANVAAATFWLAELLQRLGKPGSRPRVAVASLNPHAGEGGLLGSEESRAILPGIVLARARAVRSHVACELIGPVPAETAFRKAAAGDYDGVVAMYHDQATIPMKLVGFGEAVNVSLGLPIIRTSVDHGTGYDIAGKGVADPRGMLEAMTLATRLSAREGRRTPETASRRGRSRTRSR
jgi:4-hydroxythreonine-4-phosphate dehydrogenase